MRLVHYCDVLMGTMAPQITSLTVVYSTVYSGADQRKHQSSAPLAFVRGIHRWPVNSPHRWPVTQKMFHLMTSLWPMLIKCILVGNHSGWCWTQWLWLYFKQWYRHHVHQAIPGHIPLFQQWHIFPHIMRLVPTYGCLFYVEINYWNDYLSLFVCMYVCTAQNFQQVT